MYRFLLSALSIFFLLAATILPPVALARTRCTVKLPTTLLSLYRASDFIYIGTYDKLEEGDLINETDDYREVSINKLFSISSSLKGETRKMITLKDSEYRSKVAADTPELPDAPDDSEPETDPKTNEDAGEVAASEESDVVDSDTAESEAGEEIETGEEDSANEVRPGDSVLLFLNKDEDSENLVLSDYTDGLKKMTPDKLASYEVRIRELNEIFGGEKPSYSRIVAWLVRCAEDPHTRWEGTYELLRSFQTMEYEAELAKTAPSDKEATESGDASGHTAEGGLRRLKEFETGDPQFARNLSEGEKLILTDVLLKRERLVTAKDLEGRFSVGHGDGDRELIELVQRWGDANVAASLVEDLRAVSADADLTSDLMPSIASILADNELLSISADYTSIRWEEADAEVESEETDSATEEPTESNEAATEGDAQTAVPSSDKGPAGPSAVTENGPANARQDVKKKTYGELRKELVDRFLARAGKLIARERRDAEHN